MKQILLTMILMVSFPVSACMALAEHGLSFKQQLTMRYTYVLGIPHDLSYSLAAIAWKESSAGKVPMNMNDPSFGAHHITIDNAIGYSGYEDTMYNRNRLAAELVQSVSLSSQYSMINLNYWRAQYGDDWMRVWASYNKGWNVKAGIPYAMDISRKVSIIKKCNW